MVVSELFKYYEGVVGDVEYTLCKIPTPFSLSNPILSLNPSQKQTLAPSIISLKSNGYANAKLGFYGIRLI